MSAATTATMGAESKSPPHRVNGRGLDTEGSTSMPNKSNGLEWPWPVECALCKTTFTPNKFANRSTRFCSRSCLERDRWENRRDREAKRASDRRHGMRPEVRKRKIAAASEWRKRNKDRLYEYKLSAHMKWKYGITQDEYQRMVVEQEDKCAVCGGTDYAPWGRLVVDHDHATNVVRGLVCHSCNICLGAAKDNVETLKRAIAYLERA